MYRWLSRRSFLILTPGAALAPALAYARQSPASAPAAPASAAFPSHDPALAREMVAVAHGNVARVRELVTARPTLSNASWDWGYGDWETALGAASHIGHREIAELLITNGARPTLFSAAMLGQLEVVRALIVASPGVQRIRGPHGITLLAHAKAGGAQAAEVVKYLESLGDADPRYASEPLTDGDAAAMAGTYAFGAGADERLIVSKNPRGALVIKREGATERNLFHTGNRVFHPAGAPAVRIRFDIQDGRAVSVTVEDGPVVVTGKRA